MLRKWARIQANYPNDNPYVDKPDSKSGAENFTLDLTKSVVEVLKVTGKVRNTGVKHFLRV